MGSALTAVIVALFIGAIATIAKWITYAFLDPEFKNLGKVFPFFGKNKKIEFEISQGIGENEIKKKESFSPRELALFLRMKYQDSKEWKGKEFDLLQQVKDDISNSEEAPLPNLVVVKTKNISMLCPVEWSVDKFEDKYEYTTIKCKSDDGISIIVKVDVMFKSIKSIQEDYIRGIGKGLSKFICGRAKSETFKGNKASSCGYAYKNEKNESYYGYVLVYILNSSRVAIIDVSCKYDWSILCSKLNAKIIDSVEYSDNKV